MYKAFDMLNPWSVKSVKDNNDVEELKADFLSLDLEYCKKNDVEYMPVVFPGELLDLVDAHLFSIIAA